MEQDRRYREHRIRTSLERHITSPLTATEMREKAEALWRHHGIVVIWPDQQLPWDMRAMAENAACRLYGERVKRS